MPLQILLQTRSLEEVARLANDARNKPFREECERTGYHISTLRERDPGEVVYCTECGKAVT